MVYTSYLEKIASPVGEALGKATLRTLDFVKKHPKSSLAAGAALVFGLPLMAERHKGNVQNYQTRLLKEMVENTKRKILKKSSGNFKRALPIVPPLR